MKAITLRHYKTPDKSSDYIKDKQYSVFLFWGKTVRVSDRKRMLAFLAAASRMLTDTYIELTWTLADACRETLTAYLMLTNRDKQHSWLHIDDARHCIEFIATKSGDAQNDCTLIMQNLMGCVESIRKVYSECDTIYAEKKSFADLRRVRIAINRLDEIKKRIENIDTLAEME